MGKERSENYVSEENFYIKHVVNYVLRAIALSCNMCQILERYRKVRKTKCILKCARRRDLSFNYK